jgi:hypothetical protein
VYEPFAAIVKLILKRFIVTDTIISKILIINPSDYSLLGPKYTADFCMLFLCSATL